VVEGIYDNDIEGGDDEYLPNEEDDDLEGFDEEVAFFFWQ